MPSTSRPPRFLWAALIIGATIVPRAASADGPASPAFLPTQDGRYKTIPHPKIDRPSAISSTSSGGWWLGTAGIAVALAVFGGVSLASRKYLPKSETSPLRVIGRTSLSPKHSVYLLKAGDKVLIIGTGPQGAPTLLGEMGSDEAEPAKARTASSMISRVRVGGEV